VEYKTKKVLTRPVLKFAEGVAHYVKIIAAMYVGKDMPAKEGENKKDPATLMDVVNLEDGEECVIVVNAVVKSVLTESYPSDGYVGKFFAITKQARAAGKQYNAFNVVEIEDPAVSTDTDPVHIPPVGGVVNKSHGKR
jgi:hypothetical protein